MEPSKKIENEFTKLLDNFGNDLVTDLKEQLVKDGVVGGGGTASKLAGSIRFVFLTGKEQGIGITMADHWEFVENGRKAGKRPPLQPIIDWIKWKGIQLKPLSQKAKEASTGLGKAEKKVFKKNQIDSQIKSLAFAISNKIAQKGTIQRFGYKGSNFASDVLNDGRVDALTKTIAQKFGIEVRINITDALKKLES